MRALSPGPVVVIGAGIVGLASATYLQRGGRKVIVVDPGGPGEGASYGNAGGLNGSSIVPVAMPGVLAKVPHWLLDPEGPLSIRLRYLPQLLPWLYRFVRAGRLELVRAQARALRGLLAPTVDMHRELAASVGVADLIQRSGLLIVYRSEASFVADAEANRLRADNGVKIDELSQDELRQIEPTLSPAYTRARFISENGYVRNPLRLSRALAEALVANGGEIRRERAEGFAFADGKVEAVLTSMGRIPVAAVVLAAGAHSKPLAARLGEKVPLDTERGYHAMIKAPEVAPRLPIMDAEAKFVAAPMEEGLRMAGTVEFAGLEAPPDWRRARILLRHGQAMFPGLPRVVAEDRVALWMGFRPSIPDSLPVIGPARRYPNAFLAFGHGHVGLIGAPMTGRAIADLIAGRPPAIDLAPFSAARFA
ncbi:MAG TPA: FAD-dependent oxidoreductase [Xanthobacteraceae bacterium]|jgi:D-amino-acid dehydrogenase|nr:FAD-dependent oxidoreductase [Xanthobacteraceae bacterium]